MAEGLFTAPTGTKDVLPPDSYRWEMLVAAFAQTVEAAGYGLVLSPMFEDIGVFLRVGESTDIVTKEMYDFRDKGDRHIALRPEGTASVVRAFNQHRPPHLPWKAWYVGPSFRYERPQAGRYRQHHQLGLEALGADDPDLDVEVITLQADFYRSLGLTQVSLLLNSMGTPADRAAYSETLKQWLLDHKADIDPADHATLETNPMRVLDSKREATKTLTEGAPRITDLLSGEAAEHFGRVREGLDAAGVTYELSHRLVRGLDYYTHTTFEFAALALDSAQNAIGGGGRYDGLAKSLGGPETPGIGFGSGIERILLACDAEGTFSVTPPTPHVFIVDVTGGAHARDLTIELRRAGLSADRAYGGRSMKSQMKAADRSGAAFAAIIGEDEAAENEVTVRDLRGDLPQSRLSRETLGEFLRNQL